MAEATQPGDGLNPPNKGDTSASDSKPSAEANQEPNEGDGKEPTKDGEDKEPTKPDVVINPKLSLADAFEKFKNSDGKPDISFEIAIPGIKYWAYGKEVETELNLKAKVSQASGGKIGTFEGEIKGSFIQKDEKKENVYLYVPPSIKVSQVLGELVKGETELESLASLFGLELTFRKFVVTLHKVHTLKKIDGVQKLVEDGYYLSIAVYADKKPEASKQYDDQYVLDTPGKYSAPFFPKSTDVPGVADQPFCIFGIGKDKLLNKTWAHVGLSLRALMHNTYEYTGDDDKEVDSWSMKLPVVGSLLSSSGRLVFGNPFVSFSANLKSAPESYLSNTRRFLKEKDKMKTNLKDFDKNDYILTMGGKARVGVTLQTPGSSKVLVFEYPSTDEEKNASRNIGALDDRVNRADAAEKKNLQRYGSVFDPGIVRLGPFTLYKMGLGIKDLERVDPSDKTIKSKKLCLVMTPGMMIGSAPKKGKSHGFIDINELTITIPVGSEKETIQPGRKPPQLISPVQFDFKGMGIELAGEDESFLLRGAAYWDISDKELSASGEVLFRLGTKDNPVFLMTIMMAFWLNSEDHKWGFFVYGLAIFRRVRAPIDPVVTQTYLTGIALGVGVNYILTIPDIDSLREFPLVKVLFDGTDVTKTGPKVAAKQMEPYLKPKSKYLWFAVGAEISTLETFTGFVLFIAIFGLGDSLTWELCLLGILTFANNGEPIYKIELLFKVLLAWYGLKIEVLLTSSSFILDKRLHLSGSGYFWTFWGGEHKGETIFVLGGYHPNYKKPAHFPNPTPVEISYDRSFGRVKFRLNGQAYFALAKKVVMLGIKLEAIANIDVIWDWSLWASLVVDILIFWSPFSLDARSRLEVGITAVVTLVFVSFRINVRIALELNFWKPDENSDFGGEFIFQVLSWKVKARFGASQKSIRPISWQQFIEGDLGLEKNNPNPLMLKVLTTDNALSPKAAASDIPWMPKLSEPTTPATDYAMADRLSPEPIFKGTTAVPIKDLKVNDKQLIADQDKEWTSDFGLVPCFYTKEAFQSELNIIYSTNGQDLFEIIPEINTVGLPLNVWSPVLLIKPNLENEGIANTLAGAAVKPKATLLKTGNKIGPFTTDDLIRHIQDFTWPEVEMPHLEEPTNTIKMATFKNQINSSDTCSRRNRLLDAIRKHQPEVTSNVRLTNTAQLAEKVLLATPVDHALGY